MADKILSTRLTIIAFLAAAWCWTSDAQLYDVACPGVNSELQCPEGHVMEVLSVQYGEKSSADCDARSQPAKVSDKDCIKQAMLGWLKLVCDNLGHCQLPKPNPQMFVCDASSDNFIQIAYMCNRKRADAQTAVICGGQTGDIKCEKGVLHIVKASFGRLDETTCTDTPSTKTFCTSAAAGGRVKEMCEGKKVCNIAANSDNLGKPTLCDSLPTYFTVDYVCQ